MSKTFFFYDLETSGLSPRKDRIMQFAGIRTDMDLQPIGEPYNVLVKLNDDTLPSPEAVMVTGITPQSTQADGYTEAEFAEFLCQEIFTPDTITVGYNNVRFDDEFIRHLFWRTFRDPYQWCWSDGCSRWDLLDAVRMTRALRPDGVSWPVDENDNPTNRLELLTKANGIAHESAHDALSDVRALIEVTKLLRSAQPKLFEYLLSIRDKKSVKKIVDLEHPQAFVYTSGRYDTQYQKTTVAYPLAPAAHGNVLVYDLRHDPELFVNLTADELATRLYATWEERTADGFVAVPLKTLQYNRCPAVAPLGVLEQSDGWQRVGLSLETIERHRATLNTHPEFASVIEAATARKPAFAEQTDPEARLYDGFLGTNDSLRVEAVRNVAIGQLADFEPGFEDERLKELFVHYKARNYPQALTEAERAEWEGWRSHRLSVQLPSYIESLQKLSANESSDAHFLLEELRLWAENIAPFDEA